MKTIFIHLAQTGTGSIVMIILLLIVAAIIGYVTSWYYAKSVYTPIIKGLEKEKDELNTQVAGMKLDISDLKALSQKQQAKISDLEKGLTEKDNEIRKLKEAGKKK